MATAIPVLAAEGLARAWLGDRFVGGLPVGRPDKACAQHDEHLGWVNVPGITTRVVAPQFTYRVTMNDKGLRDEEHPYEKPEGAYRVALLGDSIAWGWGVDDGLAFADLVEERLGPDVEVINLGVPGYSTDQHLWTLERDGLRYDPDLVLLCFVLNDVVGNDQLIAQGRPKPCFKKAESGWSVVGRPAPLREFVDDSPVDGALQALYWRSALLQAVAPPDAEKALALEAGGRGADGERRGGRGGGARSQLDQLADEITRRGSSTRMLLGRIARVCRERDLPLVAFNIAHHHDQYLYWPDNQSRPAEGEGDELLTRTSRRLRQAGREIGFETFSVDAAMFAETGRGVVLTCGDGHLNERGNEVVTEVIVEHLAPLIERHREGSYAPPPPRGS